jgi:hypothetical protein
MPKVSERAAAVNKEEIRAICEARMQPPKA